MLSEIDRHIKVIDATTGLKNRRYLELKIAELMKQGQAFSLIGIVLDDMGKIHQQYGKAIARSFLKKLSRAITQIEKMDVFKDEGNRIFLLCTCNNPKIHERVEEAIYQVIGKPIEVGQEIIVTGCSMSTSNYPDHGKTLAVLLDHLADQLKRCFK